MKLGIWLALGELRAHPWRLLVALAAIAIGVALGLAVQLINASAAAEFAQAVRATTGQADLEIRGPRGGFDERVLERIAADPAVAVASPMVEVDAQVLGGAEATPKILKVIGIDLFRAGQAALLQKNQHGLHVIRRPKAQNDFDAVTVRRALALAPQRRRAHAVVRGQGGVEAAQAGKAGGQRHLRDGQARVGQQLLGGQQAARLQPGQGRHAQFRLEHAAQVPVAHAQARRQPRHAGRGITPGIGRIQQARGVPRQQGRGVLRRPGLRLRRQLGPAAQAGAKAGAFGLRRVGEEAAVLAPRRLHAAHGAAVDAGGGDTDEERAVEACVVRHHGAVAGVGIEG